MPWTRVTMHNEENTTQRPSGLRQPSRIPATVGLHEMSQADTNARAMPPPTSTLKHKATGRTNLPPTGQDRNSHETVPVPEPAPKRKTLSERAADNHKSIHGAPPSTRPLGTTYKSGGSSAYRPVTLGSSASARTNGFGSRNISNGSASTSSSRPASAASIPRAQTSMAFGRANAQDNGSGGRSASVAGQRDDDIEANGVMSKRKAWDTAGRLEDMESLYTELKTSLEEAVFEKKGVEESLNLYKTRIVELEQIGVQLTTSNKSLSDEVSEVKVRLASASLELDDARRKHGIEIDDLVRKHRNLDDDREEAHRKELERTRRDDRDEKDRLRREFQEESERLQRAKRDELAEQEKMLTSVLHEERSLKLREIQDLTAQHAIERHSADTNSSKREHELHELRKELDMARSDVEGANTQIKNLKANLTEATSHTLTLETSMKALRAKIEFLESDNQAQSQSFADLHQKMQDAVDRAAEAQDKLRTEETLRRKLHNQVQELKGNIRVFCRVRPILESEADEKARIAFPDSDADSKEVAFQSEQKSATGNVSTATSSFSFDRVFSPSSQNGEVFEEISQLIQSALDGYNVCIFCYGQTGSGKTYTMSSADGMIPRGVTQIYDTAKSLEDKGWTYTMEGSFIEVYNDTLNDLLGKAEDWEKKKHEIKHDPTRQRTTVTDVTMVPLDSPTRVNAILEKAGRNRSVAATKANARSSRSHSVFILKLVGENSITGEKSEGTLNLVDLAGSERLSHSGATGERMKETQHINKSLACLGDVIGALGQGKEGGHVPYRNSKLTYLLQYSLGGNSKTLMFVMISPLQAHMGESLTSLKFATKVHNTHIGTAKRQTRA